MTSETPIVIGFFTSNAHKLRETAACFASLAPEIRMIAIPPSEEVEESGTTFLENAKIKLEAALKEPLPPEVTHVIAEDAGLIIDALDGTTGLSPFPGLYSDRWFSPTVQQSLLGQVYDKPSYVEKNQGILKLMEGISDRSARYEACVVCWERSTGNIIETIGTVPLAVAHTPRGENGFGYDPIMIPMTVDPNRTMAELSSEEKNAISHRFQAISQLAEALQKTKLAR